MVEARRDAGQHGVQGGKKLVVRRHAAGQFPDSLDGGPLRTVRRQKQQGEHDAVFSKQGLEQDRVVVPGIVQHQHQYHAHAARTLPQPRQKGLERGAQGPDELAGVYVDGTKAGDRLAGGRMEQDRILDLGRHPHAAPGAMLLEVAFVHAPKFNAPVPGQAVQFFLNATTLTGSD
ncbi:MAG: hypothetical protein ABIQ79_04280 [Nitrospiraceae bacterium]